MLPGPDLVIACPKCSAPHRVPTLESGNTFGAKLWTDGYMDAPMLPPAPAATQCHSCNSLFWVADAPELGEIESRFGPPMPAGEITEATAAAWRSAPEVRELTKAQCYRALDSDMVTSEERERHLRMLAWHASNRARRSSAKAAGPDERDRFNMERLLEMHRGTLFEAALVTAELLRELGRWDEVGKYLGLPFPEDMLEVGRRIAALAGAKDSRVARADD